MGPPNRPLSAAPSISVPGLDQRSALILRELVETYVATGEPVGSRTLSRRLPLGLSPATIRNAMADLEEAGLLYAPHTSAGRCRRNAASAVRGRAAGIRRAGEEERDAIAARCAAVRPVAAGHAGRGGQMLSGLAGATGLVVAPKAEAPLRHIEFVALGPGRALVVLVHRRRAGREPRHRGAGGAAALGAGAGVQLPECAPGRPHAGRARGGSRRDHDANRTALDALTQQVIEAGLAPGPAGRAAR
jgi:heat-inducible transcriptional repressor